MGDALWEPFTGRAARKSAGIWPRVCWGTGSFLNPTTKGLGLVARAWWTFSNEHGFVRTVSLEASGEHSCEVQVLDALRDLQVGGASLAVMQSMSCLVNAYTRSECVGSAGGHFAMETALSDRAEPAESLRATTVFAVGNGSSTLTRWRSNRLSGVLRFKSVRRATGRAGQFAYAVEGRLAKAKP